MDKNELTKDYNKLRKIANKRLYELEKASHIEGYKNIKKLAYKNSLFDIRRKTKDKSRRYKKLTGKENSYQILSLINSIKRFLDAPSSTTKGYDEVNERRMKTLKDNYNIEMSKEDFSQFMEDGGAEMFDKYGFSSESMINIIGVFSRNGNEIKNNIDDFRNRFRNGDIDLNGNTDKDGLMIINKMNANRIEKLLKDKRFDINDFI